MADDWLAAARRLDPNRLIPAKLGGEDVALLKTFLRYLLCLYVMCITNSIADERGVLLGDHFTPLPDLGADMIPFFDLVWLADSLSHAACGIVALRCYCHVNAKRLGITFLDLHTVLVLLRCTTLPLTVLPAPRFVCSYRLEMRPAHFLLEPVVRMLRPGGMSSWCHDMLFSGHGMLYMLTALFLNESDTVWWRLVGWSLCFTGFFALLAARVHYTVDLWLSCVLSTLVFQLWKNEVRQYLSPCVYVNLGDRRHRGADVRGAFIFDDVAK